MTTCNTHGIEVTRSYCPVSGRYRPICPECEREAYERSRMEYAQ